MLRTPPRQVFPSIDALVASLGPSPQTDVATEALAHTAVAFVGGAREARAAAVVAYLRDIAAITPDVRVVLVEDTGAWPFARTVGADLPLSGPIAIWARNLHEAFPAGQTGGTRLVLTQSTYQLQRWMDWIGRRGDVRFIMDADAVALERVAPEAFARRGPWSRVHAIGLGERSKRSDAAERFELAERLDGLGAAELLQAAFRTTDPDARLAACRRAAEATPDAVTLVALGSAYMEVQDLDEAERAIGRAVALSPEWEAAHFEQGKLWLRRDGMERASGAFAEAGRLMPTFAAAFTNLGAALGELNRPEEGLRAFEQALAHDPNGYTILNNVGVVSRELGRLAESEAAFRKVVALAPDFVFGHYNLGHTLFLQGRYQAALSAYAEGQRRDPGKNARQACRLAVVRLAAGDPEGAQYDLERYTATLPPDARREILSEAQEILWALLTAKPSLEGWRAVADWVQVELSDDAE